jgi:putative transcriptional regulator
VGKLARSRVAIDDGPLRSSLLHIGAGGEIPEHTHTGFEVTLLLDGEFSDEEGSYVPGDFIWQDGSHQHTPLTKDGCLCFTVVSSALHFNKGLSKLLNPIGNLIY